MFSSIDAQSEIARRQEFVSSGMQSAQLLSSLVSSFLGRLRDRLRKAMSSQLTPQGQQVSVPSQVLQS